MNTILKNTINDIITTGNKLLSKGIIFYGMNIHPEEVNEYNLKLRELKNYCYSSDRFQDILDIEIIEHEDLVKKETEQPPGFLKRWLVAYWTGDIFLSRQTTIKSYIRETNMRLDFFLNQNLK